MASKTPVRKRGAEPAAPAPDRKTQIIRAAEMLFAQFGFAFRGARDGAQRSEVCPDDSGLKTVENG